VIRFHIPLVWCPSERSPASPLLTQSTKLVISKRLLKKKSNYCPDGLHTELLQIFKSLILNIF
jgi:hypothetical protein